MGRILAVFDFDHTIIDMNSDIVIRNLLPKEEVESAELRDLRQSSWTEYMAEVFRRLPLHGVGKDRVISLCQNLRPSKGMIDLFAVLRDINADVIILSDANSVIISSWLSKNIPDMAIDVFTNPAVWSDGGVLTVKPFQQQTECSRCPANLCKGSILLSTLASRSPYDFTMYTGDGKNDLCPALKLRSQDMVFPRKGFTLEKLVKAHNVTVSAAVHVWAHAGEIKEQLFNRLEADASI